MKLKETIEQIIGIGVFVGLVGLTYQSCFASRTVKDVIIVKKEIYEIEDIDTGYYEEQNMIVVDDGHCFRAPKPFGESLEVGDKLSEIKYRPSPFGGCDFVKDYQW